MLSILHLGQQHFSPATLCQQVLGLLSECFCSLWQVPMGVRCGAGVLGSAQRMLLCLCQGSQVQDGWRRAAILVPACIAPEMSAADTSSLARLCSLSV